MEQNLIRLFEKLSGWRTPEDFAQDNEGYVTFEDDPKSHRREAFLWKPDGSHEHLETMWVAGHTFVRR